ncbi:AAA family ATPase [Clostridium botulinum]|uniref:VirB4 family type IV secretion system protein n=1 Tax=Clostridium botulinum TaxID=1491 RepID=UPI00099D1C6B|nr:ATP-binding protein [Clostridium botulinum]MCC5439617.1 ATP-binding protein [Clostridium botulinum]NFR57687.1 DUF87 domain-containing protein [Clostridium botulinum]OPD35515.1 AAA family ATPase [Clostridium botulinum]
MLFKKKKKNHTNFNVKMNKNYYENIEDNVPEKFSFFSPEAIMEEKDYMYLGHEHYIRSFAISVYPRKIYVGFLDALFNIGEIDLSVYCDAVPNDIVVKQLTKKSVQAMSEYNVYMNRGDIYNTPVLEEMIRDLEEERANVQTNKDKLFFVTISIVLHAKSLEELQEKTLQIEDMFAGKAMQTRTLTNRQIEGLIKSIPVCQPNIKEYERNMTSYGVSALFPISNPDLTHPNGAYVGRNLFSGSPVFINQFIGPPLLNNPNIGVFGIPGSGKSVFIKSFINKHSSLGTKVAVLDPEGEYRKSIVDLMDGVYITITAGEISGINLFDILEDFNEKTGVEFVPIMDKVSDIKDLLSSIMRSTSGRPLNGLELVAVETAVIETYANFGINKDINSLYQRGGTKLPDGSYAVGRVKKKMPTLSHFHKNLSEKPNAKELSNILIPYLRGNSMGMFDCESTLPDDVKIIGFDLSHISDEFTKFYSTFVLLSWLWQKFVMQNKSVKKIIAVDETWMFVKYPESAHFLELLARRGRKHKCSLLFASQYIDEFLNNESGLAVIKSCATSVLLRQNPQPAEQIVQYYGLASGTKEYLTTFSNGECILSMQGAVTAVQVEPIPYEFPYITTS